MQTKQRVLVVDDEVGILRFIQASLTVAGYEVVATTSGEEALRLAKTENPDIMLLDILMMPMSGFDVLDKLRKFSQVPVIIFTARSFIAEKAMQIGANGFIAKPFKPDELEAKVKAVLEQAKLPDRR